MEKEILFLKPFIIYSDQVRQSFPILAYYLKMYAVKKAGTLMQKYNIQNDGSTALPDLISEWQGDLNQLSQQLGYSLQNTNENKQKIIDYTLQIFAKADHEDRNNTFTKETQSNMTLVSRYLEMLAVFGPLTEDLNQKRIYSKAKAVEIKKKLDNPQFNQRPANTQLNNSQNFQQPPQPNQQNNFNNFQQPSSQQPPVNNNFNQNNISNSNNNNNYNNNFRQSVFNNLPTIVNAGNIKQVAHNYNDASMGEQVKAEIEKKPSNEPSKKFSENYKPAAAFVQFANPYLNRTVQSNISQQEAQAKVVDYCQTAISELDFNQFANAKEALKLALQTISNVSR